jgi:hypothetical protein
MAEYSPIDFGAAFSNVANALPDYATQDYNERMARTQAGTLALNRAKEQRDIDEQAAFADAYEAVEENPTVSGWVGLIGRFPGMVEQIKAAKGYQDEATSKAERTLKGRIFSAAGNGEWGMAADIAEERYRADEAAGVADQEDLLVIQAMRSDDPVQRNKALAMIGFDLAMDDPKTFAETYKTLLPDADDLEYHEGAWWNKKTGKAVTQSFFGKGVETPAGYETLGRHPNVEIAGLGVTPEGLPPTAGPGGFAGGAGLPSGFNPSAPSLYGPGGLPPAPGGVPGMVPQPGQMPAVQGPLAAGVPGGAGGPMEPYYPQAPAMAPPGPAPAAILDGGPAVIDPLAPEPAPAALPPPPGAQPPPSLRDKAQTTDVRNFLVGNAKGAIESIFPDAKVTEWRRDPKSKLGKANPKSWHNHSRAAVDVKPIPGLSFGAFIDRIKAEGYKIVEKRDEVTNPSKHSTGPHWHTVLQLHPARSKQEFDKIPSGGRFLDPNGLERRKI